MEYKNLGVLVMVEKNKELKDILVSMFPDNDEINKLINSDYFDLSQEVIKLEAKANIDQKQAADTVGIPLKEFLEVESGLCKDKKKYEIVIDRLKLGSETISYEEISFTSAVKKEKNSRHYTDSIVDYDQPGRICFPVSKEKNFESKEPTFTNMMVSFFSHEGHTRKKNTFENEYIENHNNFLSLRSEQVFSN